MLEFWLSKTPFKLSEFLELFKLITIYQLNLQYQKKY